MKTTKRLMGLLLAIAMVIGMLPVGVFAATTVKDYADAADGELLYTVDFSGTDGVFTGAAIAASSRYTVTGDGSALVLKGDGEGKSAGYIWGGQIGSYAADATTYYTMTYKIWLDDSVTSGYAGVGGVRNGTRSYYNFCTDFMTDKAIFRNRSSGVGSQVLIEDFSTCDTETIGEHDYYTIRVTYDGATATATGYILKDGKSGAHSEDWIQWNTTSYSISDGDILTFCLYAQNSSVDGIIRDVKYYKGDIVKTAAWEQTDSKDATCGDGYVIYTCSCGCGETYKETIPGTGEHSYGDTVVVTAPTCSTVGSGTQTCSVCGDIKTTEIAVDSDAHSFTNYVKGEGALTETAVCDNGCGNEDTRAITFQSVAKSITYLSDVYNTDAKVSSFVDDADDWKLDENWDGFVYVYNSASGRAEVKKGNANVNADGYRTVNGVDIHISDIVLGWPAIRYEKGLGVHPSDADEETAYVIYDVTGLNADYFYSVVGITGEGNNPRYGKEGDAQFADASHKRVVSFQLLGSVDGSEFEPLHSVDGISYSNTGVFNVPITGYNYIKLVTTSTGGSNEGTGSAWADACVYALAEDSACEHKWDEGTQTTDPGCTAGVMTYTCGDCSATKTVSIAALGHKYEVSATQQPTCTQTGTTTYTCSVCGGTKSEAIAINPNAHSFTKYVGVPGTYTETAQCDHGCNETQTRDKAYWTPYESAKYLGSDLEIIDSANGKSAVDTYINEAYSGGGIVLLDEAASEGDSKWSGGTAFEKGLGVHPQSASNPGFTEFDLTKLDVDVDTFYAAVGFTNTSKSDLGLEFVVKARLEGEEAYTTLDTSGNIYRGSKNEMTVIIPEGAVALRLEVVAVGGYASMGSAWANACVFKAHNFEYTVTKAATCTEPGSATYTCTDDGCDESYEADIPATGHSYVDTVVPPTCTEKGYTIHTCSVCEDSYNDTEVAAAGHSFTGYVKDKTALTETAKCDNCEVTDTRSVSVEDVAASVTYLSDLYTSDAKVEHFVMGPGGSKVSREWKLDENWDGSVFVFESESVRKGVGSAYGKDEEGYDQGYRVVNGTDIYWTDIVLGYPAVVYNKGLSAIPSNVGMAENASITYDVQGLGEYFYAVAGITGSGNYPDYTDRLVDFVLWGKTSAESEFVEIARFDGIRSSNTAVFNVSISGYEYIKLEAITQGTTNAGSSISWGNACVYSLDESECEHNWNEGEITTAPTCTGAGVMTYTCGICSVTKTVSVKPLGHAYEADTTEATCTEDGQSVYTCKNDPTHTYTEVLEATGHTFSEYVTGDAPNTEKAQCEKCDAYDIRYVTYQAVNVTDVSDKLIYLSDIYNTDALIGHYMDQRQGFDWALDENHDTHLYVYTAAGKRWVVPAPDSTDDTRVLNGHEYHRKDIALGVSGTVYEKGLSVRPSDVEMDEQAFLEYNLTNMDVDHFYAVVGMLGEGNNPNYTDRAVDFELWGKVSSTDGYIKLYAVEGIRGSDTGVFDVDITGYNYIKLVAATAGSNDAGTTVAWGDACVYSLDESGCEHNWAAGEVTAATCEAAGEKTYNCSVCNATKTVSIMTENHALDDGVVETAATCADPGVMKYTCTVCGAEKKELISKLNYHNYVEGVCNICGSKNPDYDPDPCEHVWNEGEVTSEPTCTVAGEKILTCSACGTSKTESILPNGEHTWNDGVVSLEPTYDADGERTYTCTVCGESYTEAIDMLSFVAQISEKKYSSLQEAVNAAGADDVVTLVEDTTENVTVANGKTLYLDLNGNDVASIVVEDGGVFYGMDTTTDDYICGEDDYGKIGTISGDYEKAYISDVAGYNKRYVAVNEDGEISFHRFYMGITHVALRPGMGGAGYTMTVAGDSKVQSILAETDAYGYTVSVTADGKTLSETYSGNKVDFIGGAQNGVQKVDALTIDHILVANGTEGAELNAAMAEQKIDVTAFIQFEGMKAIEGSTTGRSFKEIVLATEAALDVDSLSAERINALSYMYNELGVGEFGWEIPKIAELAATSDSNAEAEAVSAASNSVASNSVAFKSVALKNVALEAATVMAAETEIELFDISGSSMTLGNTLEINFAINTTKLTGTDNYIVISKEYADDRGTVTKTVQQSDWAYLNASTSYVSYSVSAKEMNDKLTVIAYNADGEQLTNIYEDSVAAYCLRTLAKEEAKASSDPQKLALFVDMLLYGAAAQTEWNYNTDAMADAGLTDAQKGYATPVPEKNNILQEGVGYYGTSLSLKENILMNVAYNASQISDASYAVVTFVDHYGNDDSVTVQAEDFLSQGDNLKYISITAMAVADYRQAVTVTLYDAEGNAISTTVDSVESYLSRKSGALYDAIAAFGDGAYNYFHTSEDSDPGTGDNTTVITGTVSAEDGTVTEDTSFSDGDLSAQVPAGVQVEDSTLTLTVTEKAASDSGVALEEGQQILPLDIHIDGISAENATPIQVCLGKILPGGLNIGNVTLYHVEEGAANEMTRVMTLAELDEHNEFYYDPITGDITVAMASFSEVAMVSNEENAWNGEFDDFTGSGTEADPYIIANADQLAQMSKLVSEDEAYASAHYKLISDINLNGEYAQANERKDLMFYPIGYWAEQEGTNSAGEVWYGAGNSFTGVFDGNGNTISNIYQNTWLMDGNYDAGYWKTAMGLFGALWSAEIKNLTVDNFQSDGEFTPTGCIAAYAGGPDMLFENISLTNCNPRVYNTGNGGLVGLNYNSDSGTADELIFRNVTVDQTNKISALWGSYDVSCGGILGRLRENSKHDGTNTEGQKNTVEFDNCHVAAIMDVNNDCCANYQYYQYRYSGMLIGTVDYIGDVPAVGVEDVVTASNSTVTYGDWNEYWYCELVKNSLASYTHDHQFSRLTEISDLSEIKNGDTWIKEGNFVLPNADNTAADCYHIFKDSEGNLYQHFHDVEDASNPNIYEAKDIDGNGVLDDLKEDRQRYYIPFGQLWTGYGWGSSPMYVFDGVTVANGGTVKSEPKFESKNVTAVSEDDTVKLGDLFTLIADETKLSKSTLAVFVSPVGESSNVSANISINTNVWGDSTLTFSGNGLAKIVITDYYYCTETVLYIYVLGEGMDVVIETKIEDIDPVEIPA